MSTQAASGSTPTRSTTGPDVVPRLLPVHLEAEPPESFRRQLEHLRRLTGGLVEWLEPAPLTLDPPR